MTDKKPLDPSVRNLSPAKRAEIDRLLDLAMKGEAVIVICAKEPPDKGILVANVDFSTVLDMLDATLATIQDGNYVEVGKDADGTKH